MAVEPQPQNSPSNSGDGTAFILAAIDRVAADSRSNYEQLAAEMRRSHDQLAADSRSNYEQLTADRAAIMSN